jgi:hypothetical protein
VARRRPDEHHPADVVLGKRAVPARLAADVEQPDPLVVAQGVRAHAGRVGDLGDREGLLLYGDCAHAVSLRLRARSKSRGRGRQARLLDIGVLEHEGDSLTRTDTDPEHPVAGLAEMKFGRHREDVPGPR